MTYLAGSVQSLVTDRNTWHSRSDQAWGASRVWNSGSSFETDSATWHSRSDSAWGPSRVWNSGVSFETNANNAWGPSRAYGSGNSFETNFNNLQAGLNSPDGEATVPVTYATLPASGTTAVTTLTFARTGHFVIGAYVDGQVNLNSFGATVTVTLGGVATGSKVTNGWTNTSTGTFHAGFVQHVDVAAGQTLTISITTAFIVGGNASGLIYAHFVPTATNHN